MARSKLTKQQKQFVDEYILDLNATQAAIRAGYSEKTAQEQSSRLLSNVMVSDAVAKAMKSREERVKIDADYVLKRLVQIDEMDVTDILDDAGNIKAIREWPVCWRRTISGLDIAEIISGDTQTVLKKIKWPDKVKNLELLGKHVNVQAFKEQHKIDGDLTVTNLIADLSKRNAEQRAILPKQSKK